MATRTPPTRPTSIPPLSRQRRGVTATRVVAAGAIAGVAAILLLLVFAGGGGADYQLTLPETGQLVRGDQVQVGGVPVGIVKNFVLLPDYRVRVTIHVNSSLTPLHRGTTTEIRVPSLSTVANRYLALSPGPNNAPALAPGATLPVSASHGVVDLDQLLNLFNAKTRKGLQQFIQGSAQQYAGAGPALQADSLYFSPSLTSISHVFAEIARDQPTLSNFLVETAKTVTTLAARSHELTELVSHANTTFAAIGSQQSSFAKGLKALPVTLKQGNRTFEELPATLADLRKLVDVSKPNTKTLAPFFSKLRGAVTTATPVVSDVAEAISKPGSSNDLTEVALVLPALANALASASPDGVRSLEETLPVTALFGPYTPDLEGLIRDFGQGTAYYDANGHYARANGLFPDFALDSQGTLKPVNPQQALQGLKTGQLRRCPGSGTQPAADGSSPFTDNGLLGCDPSQTP